MKPEIEKFDFLRIHQYLRFAFGGSINNYNKDGAKRLP
jgi:hypothetical protein